MRIIFIIVIIFFGALSLRANESTLPGPKELKCKEDRTLYSCEHIEGAKREKFCSKKNKLSKDLITKFCKKERRKRKKK